MQESAGEESDFVVEKMGEEKKMKVRHDFLWATLVHLSTNMWFEKGNTRGNSPKTWRQPASPVLRWDRQTWETYLLKLKESGVNTIILDVGDGIVYQSHPEIAVEGA